MRNEMSRYDVTDLYRQIGRVFKENGTDRVILLRSKNHTEDDGMSLEIAVDGFVKKDLLLTECVRRWPEIEVVILDLNEDENGDLTAEAVEDGILL